MLRKTSSQLKQMSRGILLGKYRYAIAMSMVANVFLGIITMITASTATSMAGSILNLAISFLLIFINALLMVGQNAFYLNMACGNQYKISDLFEGFRNAPNKTIIVTFLIQLLSVLPLLPAIIFSLLTGLWTDADISGVTVIVTCILLLIGGITTCMTILTYSQVYYLLLDFPQYTAQELMTLSRKLMMGNKLRLLYIQLSFLPLLLAGLFTFGIGFLFIDPYRQMTFVLFYLELLQAKNE